MSSLYLIRHGQAGPRQNYDALSEVGRRQAELLGEYLVGQNLRFAAIYAGALARQRQTAEVVREAYRHAGVPAPEIVTEPAWNEFDLDQVYRDLAPRLSEADPAFKEEYDTMRRQARDQNSPIHRTWLPCDTAVVRAWTEGRYPTSGESWQTFQARVTSSLDALARYGSGENIAVFTSATPIAVWLGMTLGLANGRIMRLAGVMYNSAVTTLRMRERDLTLFSFNGVPHLAQPELRTFR